jgi:hypothetical protein
LDLVADNPGVTAPGGPGLPGGSASGGIGLPGGSDPGIGGPVGIKVSGACRTFFAGSGPAIPGAFRQNMFHQSFTHVMVNMCKSFYSDTFSL